MILLSFVKYLPCLRKQYEAVKNQNITCDMERSEMRIATPAKEVLKEMTRIMSQEINARELCRKPTGEKIYRKWKTVHLRKQSDKECRECAKRPPVSRCFRLGKAKSKDDEDQRIYDDKRPEAVGVFHDDLLVATAAMLMLILYTRFFCWSIVCFIFRIGMTMSSKYHPNMRDHKDSYSYKDWPEE